MMQKRISSRMFASFVALLLLILACSSGAAFGQAITGEIQGTVLDQSGRPIPGAQVTTHND
jgi:protocatechuate 3,4-dioxygenase beta subunit